MSAPGFILRRRYAREGPVVYVPCFQREELAEAIGEIGCGGCFQPLIVDSGKEVAVLQGFYSGGRFQTIGQTGNWRLHQNQAGLKEYAIFNKTLFERRDFA
jgi:hypothetical protein